MIHKPWACLTPHLCEPLPVIQGAGEGLRPLPEFLEALGESTLHAGNPELETGVQL